MNNLQDLLARHRKIVGKIEALTETHRSAMSYARGDESLPPAGREAELKRITQRHQAEFETLQGQRHKLYQEIGDMYAREARRPAPDAALAKWPFIEKLLISGAPLSEVLSDAEAKGDVNSLLALRDRGPLFLRRVLDASEDGVQDAMVAVDFALARVGHGPYPAGLQMVNEGARGQSVEKVAALVISGGSPQAVAMEKLSAAYAGSNGAA